MRTHTESSETSDDLDHVYDRLDSTDTREAAEDTADERAAGHSLVARMLAELVGSFFLIFVGLGALLYGGLVAEQDILTGALTFGLALTAAVAAFGAVSGGHFNPAVSLGAAITGRIGWGDLLPYWLAQLVGAVGAAGLWFATIPAGLDQFTGGARAQFSQTAPAFGEQSMLAVASEGQITFSIAQVLVLVAIASAVLVAVVLGATARARQGTAAVAIGLTFAALLVLLGPISGGGVNPIRATASALFSESWALGQLWLFWIAPLIGAAIAGLLYTVIAPTPAPAAWEDEGDWDEDGDEDDLEQADADASVAESERADDSDLDLSIEPEDDEHILVVDVADTEDTEALIAEAGAQTEDSDLAKPQAATDGETEVSDDVTQDGADPAADTEDENDTGETGPAGSTGRA